MVYNSDSVWVHLYVAYEKMLHDEAYAGFDLDEAFRRLTDGVECPISRHYAPAQMIASCERAGLSARYVGGYLSRMSCTSWRRTGQAQSPTSGSAIRIATSCGRSRSTPGGAR